MNGVEYMRNLTCGNGNVKLVSKKEIGNRILIDINLESIVEAKNQLDCLSYYMNDDDNYNNSREVAELYSTIWDCCDNICRFYLDRK